MKLQRNVVLLAAAALAVCGCGSPSDLAPLRGKVSYKGKPLEFGSVMLQPAKGGRFSRADIQPDGTFVLKTSDGEDGATIGLNRVRVACFTSQNPKVPRPAGGEGSLGKPLIPEHYNSFSSSELTIDVLPVDNPPYVIELTD